MDTNLKRIRHIFGSRIFARGEKYYREGRVLGVVKIGNKLHAKVKGNRTYEVEFDLKSLTSICTCPYGINCKHGVAAFIAYSRGDFVDGDAFLSSLKEKDKEEILKVLKDILETHPEILAEIYKEEDVLSYFKGYLSYEDALKLSKKLKKISKEDAWSLLEYICEHYYDFGGFYDDYRDMDYGYLILGPLFEAIERHLSREDFDRFFELLEVSDVPDEVYDYAYNVLLKNAGLFREEILKAEDMSVELRASLLARIGEREKAEELIMNSPLSPYEKVKLLLEVNPELAEELGRKLSAHQLLIKYFGERKEHEKVIELYIESERANYLVEYVCDAIKSTGRIEVFGEIQKKERAEVAFLCALKLGLKEKIIELFPEIAKAHIRGMPLRNEILDALTILGDDLGPLIPSIKKIVEFEVAKKNRSAYQFAAELMRAIKKVKPNEYDALVKALKKKHPGIRVLWELLDER